MASTNLQKYLDFKPYKPKKGEEYMSPQQTEHFKNILFSWKKMLMTEAEKTMDHMKQDSSKLSDPNDAATQEEEFRLELRTRDRERKLISKIDQALSRIDDGSYGYCEDTGEPIGIKRLEARPIATLSIEAQERHEKMEKTQID
ncbi:MAG: RNA polymerase-binding transcription factor DksA [Ectothiorhodospiraceae bacterium]|nr:MAG: RNA polymerase-binding transcription factor DksA [Ectothiorhodospiraceae bacterium]|tara:strand:+ start:34 stop:465 length:432 start_codon:yes stop_codon:yes gene_type:complete